MTIEEELGIRLRTVDDNVLSREELGDIARSIWEVGKWSALG